MVITVIKTCYAYPSNLYEFIEVLDEAGVVQLEYKYRRRIAEDDVPIFNVGDWLLDCIDNDHQMIVSPKWAHKNMVKVEVEVPEEPYTYDI